MAFFAFAAHLALAQELGTAVLNGDVSDPSGALVKGAQITVENKATGYHNAA